MRERITSRKNPKIASVLSRLKEDDSLFLAEGFHAVDMAVQSGLAIEIFAVNEVGKGSADLFLVTPEVIEKLSSLKSPEPIVALCRKKEGKQLSSDRLLYLEHIQDPGNVGTLLRSALAFGFHDVVYDPSCADPYKSKALQAGQGAIFHLNLIKGKTLDEIKEEGYLLLATTPHEATEFESYKVPDGKLALMLGNEGQGLSEEALGKADVKLRLEIAGIESLNVAAAGAIFMHALRRING